MANLALYSLLVAMAVVAEGALRLQTQARDSSDAEALGVRITKEPYGRNWIFQRSPRSLHLHADVEHICIEGKQVPQLYLLGAQKAGTTSMALDFIMSGVDSAIKKRKELHTFDDICHFPRVSHRNNSQLRGEIKAGRCVPSTSLKKEWLEVFMPCEKRGRALVDMTPLNVRMPGLPRMMHRWYGLDRKRLGFTIILREPLRRLQSGFYYTMRFEKFKSFALYVNMIFERAPAFLDGNVDELALDFPLDEFYRSMYGVMMRPWFRQFSRNKFAIVTMRKYMDSVDDRQSIMKAICEHFNIPADPRAVTAPLLLNKGTHPALEDDLDARTIQRLNRQFFVPDAKNLSTMLMKGAHHGLLLAGYKGKLEEDAIHQFLKETW